jgi:hypothetical protein
MENKVATTQVQEVVEKFKELRQSYLLVKAKYEAIIAKYKDEVSLIKSDLEKRESELEDFEKYNIPRVFIMEVENKQLKKKYLKAVVRYYLVGEKKQKSTTIHLGQLNDYPNGISDQRLKEMANFKAMEFVQRKMKESGSYNIW